MEMEKENNKSEDPISLVKTLVSITIGSVCWLRNIFPDEVFSSKIYFVPNKNENITDLEKKQQYLKIKTIKKAISKPTDILLKIIEQHIFGFIDQGILKVLIFDVLSRDDVVLETFIIDFTFLSTFETENAGIQGFSIRKSAQNFLKNIFSMTQSLEVLQQHQKISLSVVLNEEISNKQQIADTFKSIPTSILKRKEMEFISRRNEDLSKAYCSKFEGGSVLYVQSFVNYLNISRQNSRIINIQIVFSATFSIYVKRNKRKRSSRALTFDNIVYSQKKKKHSIQIVKIKESIHDEIEESAEDEVHRKFKNTPENCEPSKQNTRLNCECKVTINKTTPQRSIFNCSGCGRICHKDCYFFAEEIPKEFSCFNCRLKICPQNFQGNENSFQLNLSILFALRNLFNKCCSEFRIPDKISGLIESSGLPKEDKVAGLFLAKVFEYKIFQFDDMNSPKKTSDFSLFNDFVIGLTIEGYDCSLQGVTSRFLDLGDMIHISIPLRRMNNDGLKKSLAEIIYDNDSCFIKFISSNRKESKELQDLAAPSHSSLAQATQLFQETQGAHDLTDANIDSDNFSLFDLNSDSHEADDDTSFMNNSFLKNC